MGITGNTLDAYSNVLISSVNSSPGSWNELAQTFLDIETTIHASLQKRLDHNSNFSSFDTFSGIYTPFIYPAILRLNTSYANISDTENFVVYQITENPFIGFQDVEAAWCLGP